MVDLVLVPGRGKEALDVVPGLEITEDEAHRARMESIVSIEVETREVNSGDPYKRVYLIFVIIVVAVHIVYLKAAFVKKTVITI